MVFMGSWPRCLRVRKIDMSTDWQSARLAAVAVAVFADDYRRANASLGRVVVERNVGLVQEGEQVVPMPSQPLDQPLGVAILPGRGQQFLQSRWIVCSVTFG